MFAERQKKEDRHRKLEQAEVDLRSAVFLVGGKSFESKPAELSFLHNEIGSLMSPVRWLGNLPLRLTETGVEFAWLSWHTLYALLAYAGSLGLVIPTLVQLSNPTQYASKFDGALFSEMYLAMFVPHLLTPVSCWLDSPGLAKYFNSWVRFQRLYADVAGKPLQLGFRRWSSRLLWISSVNSLLPVCVWMVIPPYLTPLGAATLYLFCLLHAFPIQMIWNYSCRGFHAAGHGIADCFQQALDDKACPISARDVNRYKRLWVALSELPNAFSHAMYRTYAVKTLVMFFCMTLSLYGILSCLQTHDVIKLGIFVSTLVFSTGPFYIMCDAAHWVPEHISGSIQSILKNYSPSELNPSVRDEMNAFLQVAMTQKCSMSVGGYVDVDRQLIQAAGTTTVTYLIVLLQFKISLPEDEANNINKTLLGTVM